MKFTKKDLWFCLITGLETGFIAFLVANFLGVKKFFGVPPSALIVIAPIAWIVGVNLGYLLGRWLTFFNQFGRFAAVGFTNFAVDLGVANFFIALSGIASGFWYTVFKALSFLTATLHSYIWNKYWVFDSGTKQNPNSEFAKFFSVSIVALVINVAVASIVVNVIHPLGGFSPEKWANIGAAAGSAVALAFSFVGYRLAVFHKKK